ncbi:MAG: hypothetical protein KatS3mg091_666 [Patescibacteria group bacterium]|nr:MAG: hypothetical protein KatS3mg090_0013 [Patescibacteria group bacterium]GIW63864.1 MAG: hypothetical protein KatS3mg091_666 [Patescibacteria group bacterium]GIW65021.1 MAG: hypothetical protein KatS3mg092_0954 [Patescibacteria group bacterium]
MENNKIENLDKGNNKSIFSITSLKEQSHKNLIYLCKIKKLKLCKWKISILKNL